MRGLAISRQDSWRTCTVQRVQRRMGGYTQQPDLEFTKRKQHSSGVEIKLLPSSYAFKTMFGLLRFTAQELQILLWIGEGFVLPSEINRSLEDIGLEYFRDLFSRSLILKASGDNKFVIPNLVNDLAEWISGETVLKLEEVDNLAQSSGGVISFQGVRHYSYTD